MQRRAKRILQLTLITALTIFFLALFLWNADLSRVGAILRATHTGWLLGGLLINFAALFFRTIRWRVLIDPDRPPPFYPTFFANTVGYMLSTILPIRAADVARPALLARRVDVRFSGALGTVLTERVVDLMAILALFCVFAIIRWREFSTNPWFIVVRTGGIACGAILVVMTFFLISIYLAPGFVRRGHEALSRLLPVRFRDPWMHFFDTFAETVQLANRPLLTAYVLLCTAAVWFCLTAQFWFAVKAIAHPLPYDASFFVTGITTIGLAIPTPGGVGGFHAVCQFVLTQFYGFDIDSAVAGAIVFHVVGTIPVLLTGLLLFAHEGLRWKDVTSVDVDEGTEEGR